MVRVAKRLAVVVVVAAAVTAPAIASVSGGYGIKPSVAKSVSGGYGIKPSVD